MGSHQWGATNGEHGRRLFSYLLDFCKLLPSPSGRGAGGEGLVKSGKQGKPLSQLIALTLS